MRIGIDTSYHQVLRAQCSAPHIAADHHRCRPPSLNTDKRRLCQIRASPDAKQVERHHFFWLAYRCAIITFFSKFSTFSILDPPTGHPSTSTHSFNIQTHVVAHHSRSKSPKLNQIWISHVIDATSLSPRFGPSEKEAWQRAWDLGAIKQDGTRAMDVLIGQQAG